MKKYIILIISALVFSGCSNQTKVNPNPETNSWSKQVQIEIKPAEVDEDKSSEATESPEDSFTWESATTVEFSTWFTESSWSMELQENGIQ